MVPGKARAIRCALAAPLSLVWGVKTQLIKNREGGGALDLCGRRLMMQRNNQPKVGRSVRGNVIAEELWAWSAGGKVIASFRALHVAPNDEKNKLKYVVALDGRRSTK